MDPISWIYCAESFFEFRRTDKEEKLSQAAYCLKGKVNKTCYEKL